MNDTEGVPSQPSSHPSQPTTPSASSATRRRLIGGAIVLVWLLTMGWWLHSQLNRGSLSLSSGEWKEGDTWYGLYLGDLTVGAAAGDPQPAIERQRIGHLHVVQAEETRATEDGKSLPGQRTDLTAELALTLFGEPTNLHLDGELWRALDGEPLELRFVLESRGQRTEVRARLADGRLLGTVMTGGEETPLDFPVDGDLLLSGGFGASLQLPVPAVGEEVRLDSFDPMTLGRGEAVLRALRVEPFEVAHLSGEPSASGERTTVDATVVQVTTSGLSSTAWVSPDGEVLRATTPLGLTLERIAPPETEGEPPGGESTEASAAGDSGLLELTAIRAEGLPLRRGLGRVKLRLSGDAEALANLPQDRVQRRLDAEEGTVGVLLDIEMPPMPSASMGPTAAPTRPREIDPAYLAAAPFVQSDHPKIRQQAERILDAAGARDADTWTRARVLADWVHEALDKRAVLSVPSALDVLARREGDCNEHTVLYTALARASGIPTRIAIGLVWSDALLPEDGGGYYYHAWPEVLTADGWLWLDPTLGQPLADATHIKLLNGGIETWTRLLPYLGRLRITILETEDRLSPENASP